MVALHRALTGVRTLGPGPWPVGPGGGGRCGPGLRAGLVALGGRDRVPGHAVSCVVAHGGGSPATGVVVTRNAVG